jgi:4a-hydroxytetrahydrobiopterin dehydratase
MSAIESDLQTKKCTACTGATPKLADHQTRSLLGKLSGWAIKDGQLVRTFHFKNYYETMAFVNATAWISHRQDHHPDMEVGYNKCTMRYSTHSIGGLSENDFICAAKIDALMAL